VALEFVLWVPLLLLVLLPMVALCGRIVQARNDANAAAADAARAASLQRSDAAAQQAATAAATESLDRAGISCQRFSVTVTGSSQPGGAITVAIACTTPLADLAIPGVPGQETLTGRATAPVEITRGSNA
jgi:Flp pilus assembly protein TadG